MVSMDSYELKQSEDFWIFSDCSELLHIILPHKFLEQKWGSIDLAYSMKWNPIAKELLSEKMAYQYQWLNFQN